MYFEFFEIILPILSCLTLSEGHSIARNTTPNGTPRGDIPK